MDAGEFKDHKGPPKVFTEAYILVGDHKYQL